MKRTAWIALALAATVLLPGCSNKQGETEAPVFITVTLPLQPLVVSVLTPAPVTVQTITLQSRLKNPSQLDPRGFADTQISFYTVKFLRRDGGTRVPPLEQNAAAIVVPSGGSASLTGFAIMAGSSVQRSPFDQLLPFNGGVDRETGRNEIHMFYELTFFGQTASGQRVQSETATGDFFVR